MSLVLRISLLAGIFVYLLFIVSMLRKKKLTLKYSLLWMFTAVVLLILDIFPQLLIAISKFLGIADPVNTIFLAMIFFILLLVITLTSIVSLQHNKIKTLIQNVSILQKTVDEFQKK